MSNSTVADYNGWEVCNGHLLRNISAHAPLFDKYKGNGKALSMVIL